MIIKYILLLLSVLSLATASAQVNRPDTIIYYNLTGTQYHKGFNHRLVTLKTQREVDTYVFTLDCNHCFKGEDNIGFGGHNNPETGRIFDPVKQLSSAEVRRIQFISFDDMIKFLETRYYHKRPILYFIEKRKGKYYQYNVDMMGSFGVE